MDSARATMPFSSFFYLHLTNDREHAVQPSCSPFCSLFYHSTRCSIVECSHSLSRDHPTSFGPLVFSTQVHRKAGSFFTRRTFSLCPFFLLFYLFLSHTTHVPFSFFSFFSSSPFSVTFFYRSFLRRFCFFFFFLVLVLTFFLFLFGFFLAATVVWNSNRGSIWRHPSWAGRHNCGRVDHSLVVSRLFSLPLFLSVFFSPRLSFELGSTTSPTFLAIPLPLFRSRFLIFFRLGLIYCRLCRSNGFEMIRADSNKEKIVN